MLTYQNRFHNFVHQSVQGSEHKFLNLLLNWFLAYYKQWIPFVHQANNIIQHKKWQLSKLFSIDGVIGFSPSAVIYIGFLPNFMKIRLWKLHERRKKINSQNISLLTCNLNITHLRPYGLLYPTYLFCCNQCSNLLVMKSCFLTVMWPINQRLTRNFGEYSIATSKLNRTRDA